MDFLEATEWVRNNEAIIRNKISKYRRFSPYEESDYMQEAFEAAIIAATKCRTKNIRFEAAFWVTFRNQISVVTPNNSKTHGSNSVPSHRCSVDIETITVRTKRGRKRRPDVEVIYASICDFLTKREREILYMSLGIADEGTLSNKEIARRLGCSDMNVRDTLDRAFRRIRRLIDEGKIDPKSLR
ncbi:sigma factor-like helix-turn-helix DNA-binding protein [Geobacter sp. DSM 9736]|uniref:sigma factor-like helix-turn-helix DNA-binding protein n=1 Tax=Geobacter sp. DSM 9736 TaxID=1277350 RepID=UPI000B50EA64|nr:sigma factor-like helix-turn-helix DNA-binding protein [Geobacter sp. DSM 9736]SNB45415.1 RNA polymerase sigma factor, sigma-70 family [Geobacter sp. DSM 9736]